MTSQSSTRDERKGEPSPLADPARWQQLIEEARPAAFLVVIGSAMGKRLRQHCSPEDLWQETLAHAWSAREQHHWRGSAAFRSWLLEITRNCIRDAVRRIQAEKRGAGRTAGRITEVEGGHSSAGADALARDSTTPSRILMHAERASALEQALATLPPELAQIVHMHLVEDLTMDEIAKRLGIGLSAAWRRFRKGAELVSKQLSDWSGSSGRGST